MRIVVLVTEALTVRTILTRLGESSEPPPISPCRWPPAWEMFDQAVELDPVRPERDYEFDQRGSW